MAHENTQRLQRIEEKLDSLLALVKVEEKLDQFLQDRLDKGKVALAGEVLGQTAASLDKAVKQAKPA